jgi:hypothetical protein
MITSTVSALSILYGPLSTVTTVAAALPITAIDWPVFVAWRARDLSLFSLATSGQASSTTFPSLSIQKTIHKPPLTPPLTTVFTPPAPCLNVLVVSPYTDYTLVYLPHDDSCFPVKPETVGFYSPGICPSGYTCACSLDTGFQDWTLDPGESGRRCCPR